jgi:hypothetical protein
VSRVTLVVHDTGPIDIAPRIEVSLTAGIQPEDAAKMHPTAGMSIGDLAFIHEFGNAKARQPMRAPVRRWSQRFEPKFQRAIRRIMKHAVRTQKWDSRPVKQLTEYAARSLRSDFYSGRIRPKNRKEQLARKAPETRPLIETKTLVKHMKVKAKVARRGFKLGGTRFYRYTSK